MSGFGRTRFSTLLVALIPLLRLRSRALALVANTHLLTVACLTWPRALFYAVCGRRTCNRSRACSRILMRSGSHDQALIRRAHIHVWLRVRFLSKTLSPLSRTRVYSALPFLERTCARFRE